MLWVYYVCVIFLYGAHVSAQWELRFSKDPPVTLGRRPKRDKERCRDR